jgi:hypothetical protein
MATAKSLVAGFVCALIFTVPASAVIAAGPDQPTVRLTRADQATAVASLLRLSDFATGWKGGRTKTNPLTAPHCPGFDPKESDLVVTGHADASFTYPSNAVSFDQDVQVLESDADVRTDFARSIGTRLGRCLAYRLGHQKDVTAVHVEREHFPSVGSVSAAYRATLTLRDGKRTVTVTDDFIFFGVGRTEYSFNVAAPVQLAGQLSTFEWSMASMLAKRSAQPKPCC